MRRPLVAGNWKMNGTRSSVTNLLHALKQGCERVEVAELAVFPPSVFLPDCEAALLRTQIAFGAQNMSQHDDGAYTGEVSAAMLLDYHCTYVILGHSERRTLYQESHACIAAKVVKALECGLYPIVCVGETLGQRDQGETLEVVRAQLSAVLEACGPDVDFSHAVVAYEPVWAIGTGQVATPEQAQAVHAFIRTLLRDVHPALADAVRIVYGGSVKPGNAASIFAMPDIDGALVGGASLDADQFLEIGMICNRSF
jgi:triosephosphate isomerase